MSVTGTVTFDGKMLPKGTIQFYTETGRPPVSSDIVDGKFSATLPVGKHRVEITAYRPMKNPPPPPHESVENYIPARYNTASKEMIEATEGASRDVKYELTSN